MTSYDSDSDYDSFYDSDDIYSWEEHVKDMKHIGIDAWTGEEIPGYSPYDSEEELTLQEMLEILEVESQKSQYKYTENVLTAVEMYETSPFKGEWKKELIDFFWDLKNNPRNFCCQRHFQNFPANPWDVKSLEKKNKKTVRQELEKQLVCSCNRRHCAREIVRTLKK